MFFLSGTSYGGFLEEYKLFVQRIGLVGVTNILISLSSIILLPVLTKNLTIQDYGVWGLFNTTVAFIPLIANLGLPYSMVRFLAVKYEKKEILEEFYSITFLLSVSGLIISLILFLFSKQIALVLFNGNTTVSLLLSVSVLVNLIYSSFSTYFRTFQQMKTFSILSLIQTYFMVVLIIYLVQSGYKISGVVFGYFIILLVVSLAAIVLVIRQIGFKFPKFKKIKEYLSFGMPTVPGNLSSWMVDLSDRYVIGILLGTAFVGYYTPGYTLGNLIVMFMAPFAFLLPSLLSLYYDQNKIEEVKLHLKYSLKYFLLIAIPAVFGLSFLSKPLLTVLSTAAIAQNGYLITPFVAIGALLFGVYGIISQVLALKKKTKIIGSLWIVAALINLILNIIFVPLFGIVAAAIMTLIAYAFVFVVSWIYSSKYLSFEIDMKFILKSLFASILMSFIIVYINPVSSLGIIFTVGICSIAYLLILFIIGGLDKNEIEFFKNLVGL